MEKTIDKKIVRQSYIRWMVWNLSLYQPETMQAPALVRMFGKIREYLYPGNKEEQQKLLERHLPFFNTEPFLGAIIPGIVLGMEFEKSQGKDVPDDLIAAMKSALMGPFAGIGDALLPGTLIPILLAIALGLSKDGSVTGVFFYIVAFLGIMFPVTWLLFSRGVSLGATAAEKIITSGLKDAIIRSITIIGLTVVGAIAAAYANITIGITYTSGEYSMNLNDVINGIWPKLPVYLAALGTYYLVAKKNWSSTKVILLYFVIAVIGYFTTILA